mmetsp:Transcript_12321/g.21993  ORF Transcript_12321/g.21993 Transcript_12321/m.21993 type:complete len:83 (-) Transcript_12321:414-662(-)
MGAARPSAKAQKTRKAGGKEEASLLTIKGNSGGVSLAKDGASGQGLLSLGRAARRYGGPTQKEPGWGEKLDVVHHTSQHGGQ